MKLPFAAILNFLRNIIAIILGLVIGGAVNMSLIMLGPVLIPPPPGVDMTTEEGLLASMHLFQPEHFLFPFLAHALGSLVGSFLTACIATHFKLWGAMFISLMFLYGGCYMAYLLPAPNWFEVTDIALAYLPMGYLGHYLSNKLQRRK
jgi:hypothetical protein